MNRFFVDEKINRDQELRIEGDNFHHCITVLKHKIGDNIVIFDNTENEYHCKIKFLHSPETKWVRAKLLTHLSKIDE